ncbi:MAG TPA: hypothetical protein VFJ84_02070 [Candidatus Saccharimonadales bacterium]|nr:hypothetical protein [Candidatus Saccharimonadales bacterium]
MTKNINNTIIVNRAKPAAGIYLMTVVGAAVYFVQNTNGFWNVVWAILKALVWPGFLVHRIFQLLHI